VRHRYKYIAASDTAPVKDAFTATELMDAEAVYVAKLSVPGGGRGLVTRELNLQITRSIHHPLKCVAHSLSIARRFWHSAYASSSGALGKRKEPRREDGVIVFVRRVVLRLKNFPQTSAINC
jgi:hypothetical protein